MHRVLVCGIWRTSLRRAILTSHALVICFGEFASGSSSFSASVESSSGSRSPHYRGPPPGGRVPGLAATASPRHGADNRSARSHGHAAAPGAWHQPTKLECPAHSRRDHCRDEAGLTGLCEDDDDGAERIFEIPQRAGVVPSWTRSGCAKHSAVATCRRCRDTSARRMSRR